MLKKLFGWQRKKADSGGGMVAGVDLEMKYCPRCGDEYRAEMTSCISCQVALISGREKLGSLRLEQQTRSERGEPLRDDEQVVVLRQGKLRDLKPLQMLLADEAISARLTNMVGGATRG